MRPRFFDTRETEPVEKREGPPAPTERDTNAMFRLRIEASVEDTIATRLEQQIELLREVIGSFIADIEAETIDKIATAIGELRAEFNVLRAHDKLQHKDACPTRSSSDRRRTCNERQPRRDHRPSGRRPHASAARPIASGADARWLRFTGGSLRGSTRAI